MSLAIRREFFINNVQAVGDLPNNDRAEKRKGLCDKITHSFNTAIKEFVHALKHIAEFMAHSVTTHTNMQAFCKFIKSTIAFFKYAFKAESTGFNNLRTQLDIVDGFLDVPEFIVDAREWLGLKKDHADNNREKAYWNQKGITKWKIISKAVGTVAKAMGTVNFFMTVGLFGRLSATLNTIPFFNVVLQFSPWKVGKDFLTIISSSLGIVDHGIGLHRKDHQRKIIEFKQQKWQVKNALREFVALTDEEKLARVNAAEAPNPVAKIENYIEGLKKKYLSARQTLQNLGAKPRKENQPLSPDAKWVDFRAKYQNRDEQEITKCSNKISEKGQNLKDNRISKNKDWFAIAFNVAKIVSIMIGLVGVFFASISGLAPFLVTVAVAWFITSSVGMSRVYYGFKHKNVI